MVGFRNAAGNSEVVQWWDDGEDQIAFARRGKGFIAINNDDEKDLKKKLKTTLPPGQYLNVINGETVLVQSDGTSQIEIKADSEIPVVAIHIDSKKE